MSSLIQQLQGEALDNNVQVSDLLRKSLVVARKLDLSDFQKWIEQELNGYKDALPDYRTLHGEVKGWDPYQGWMPIFFKNPKTGEVYSTRNCGQSIAELEYLLIGENPELQIPFSQEIQNKLSSGFGFDTKVTLFISPTFIIKIIDAVKNIILDWALKLEEDGILGEGLSFSKEDKERAGSFPQSVNNFYGTVHNPQIQQGNESPTLVVSNINFDMETISKFTENLKEELPNLDLDESKKTEIESDIATIEAQVKSPKPKEGILKESLSSVRTILEGGSGAAVGHLVVELGKWFTG